MRRLGFIFGLFLSAQLVYAAESWKPVYYDLVNSNMYVGGAWTNPPGSTNGGSGGGGGISQATFDAGTNLVWTNSVATNDAAYAAAKGYTDSQVTNIPMCSVWLSVSKSLAADTTYTIPMTNILVDTHSGYSTNTYRYTFPSSMPGYYSAYGQWRQLSYNANSYFAASISEVTPAGATNAVSTSVVHPVISGVPQTIGSPSHAICYTGGVHAVFFAAYSVSATNTIHGQPWLTFFEVKYERPL